MDRLAKTVNLRKTHSLKSPIVFSANIATTYFKAIGSRFYEPIVHQFRNQENISSVKYIPNVVAPLATIEDRAKQLVQKLEKEAHEKKDRVHLVTYSFAGVDARAAISLFGGHEFV
jgi:hypothetical protein